MPISVRAVIRTTVALLAIGFMTLVSIVGMTVWLNEQAQQYTNNAIKDRDVRVSAVDLRSAIQIAESSQRGYLTLGNEIYLAPFDNARVTAKRELERLPSLLNPVPESEAVMERLSKAVTEKFNEMDSTVALKRNMQNAEALELFRSNRGKVLMDEINVFLSSIIRNSDARLTTGVIEQKANAEKLRLASGLGGLIILLVAGTVTILGSRYAREIADARDQVRILNINLEKRVAERTSALGRALGRAELLLAEVNHRVANSLMLVASLVKMQARSVQDLSAKKALGETESRIYAIADVHKQLYNSGDVEFVALNEYLADLLRRLESTMQSEGHGAGLRFDLDPIKTTPDASVNLGIVMNEWVTNAFKYAYPSSRGEVRVSLKRLEESRGELIVEDDGIGIKDGSPAKGTGLGVKLVSAMAANLNGEVRYVANVRGTTARLEFPIST